MKARAGEGAPGVARFRQAGDRFTGERHADDFRVPVGRSLPQGRFHQGRPLSGIGDAVPQNGDSGLPAHGVRQEKGQQDRDDAQGGHSHDTTLRRRGNECFRGAFLPENRIFPELLSGSRLFRPVLFSVPCASMGAVRHGRLRRSLEFQGKGIDAVARVFRRQAFSGEDVPQMCSAPGACDLRAPPLACVDASDGVRQGIVKAGPARIRRRICLPTGTGLPRTCGSHRCLVQRS